MMQTNLQLDLAFNYLENTGTNIFQIVEGKVQL